MSEAAPIAVFLHAGDYDRVHQGLSIAAAAAAGGRPVNVFWFWWALERLAHDTLDEPDFGPGREEIARRFEQRGAPTLRQLLEHLRTLGGCRHIACTGSLSALGLSPEKLEKKIDAFFGWSTILSMTERVTDRFYL